MKNDNLLHKRCFVDSQLSSTVHPAIDDASAKSKSKGPNKFTFIVSSNPKLRLCLRLKE